MPLVLAIIPQVPQNEPVAPYEKWDGSLSTLLSASGAERQLVQPRRRANGVEADKARRSVGDYTASAVAGALPEPAPGGPAALLGRYGKNVSPPASGPDPAGLAARVLSHRFTLQAAARRLLPLEAVAGCLRRRQAGKECVDLWHLPGVGRARYGGLQTCSSVWACPVCAAKITERRRLEVREAIDAWNAQGGDVALVTFTVRHKRGDHLRDLLAGMMGALRRSGQGKEGMKFRGLFGVAGMIRSVEVTYGADNGWHPHIHALIFVPRATRFELLWQHYRKQWDAGLRLEGMRDVTARGVDMRWANADIAEYVAKMGAERSWDIEHELTKGPSKLGRGEHFTPVQLLAGFASTGDYLLGRLWQVYATELKGTHQLRWSPGLRARLGLAKVKTDEEVADETDALGVLLARLDKKQWATVLHFEARADLLNVAAAGDADAVKWYLLDLDWTLAKEDERRITRSLQDSRTEWDDQREAEAEELGLTRAEYLRWRSGGMAAIGSLVPSAFKNVAACEVVKAGKGNAATLALLGRRVAVRGRARVAALPWLTSADADPEADDDALADYGSNGYSERFKRL